MNSTRGHILIVDDDRAFRVATAALLQDEGYTVRAVQNATEGLRQVQTEVFDLILSDLVMEGMNGIEFLRSVRSTLPDAVVIMVTGFGSIQTAVEAMRHGAYDYLTKPCGNEELLIRVQRALSGRSQQKELERLRDLLASEASFAKIVSRNEKMKNIFRMVRQVAETDVTVLLLGETGTGKELLAKAIHITSPRRDQPFIVVQCSALPETLLESELFGYERGAFTGALRQHRGKFEEARGGTIFLDEIGDIPMGAQTKLLRVLQDKQFTPLGGHTVMTADVRIIAATNRDLEAMVEQGKFRSDLLYRLNVFPITLPPLRERMDDLPLLAEHLLEKHRGLARQPVKGFSPAVMSDMLNHDWMGNIRELENLIRRALIKADGPTIAVLEIPQQRQGDAEPTILDTPGMTTMPYKVYMEHIVRDAEQKYLLRMLAQSKGNLNKVARLMEVDRKTIYRKINEFQIDVKKFKA